jgi:WD40 repeat protein
MSFSYSSFQFSRDWRYAIDKSFVSPTSKPFDYCPSGEQSWGDEVQLLKFDSAPNTAAVSPDGKYLAVAVGTEVHVCDLITGGRRVLRGHVSQVNVVAFRPGQGKLMLVSCAMNSYGGSKPGKESIVFWDLDIKEIATGKADPTDGPGNLSIQGGPSVLSKEEIAHVSRHAVRAVVERLSDRDVSLHLGMEEQDLLATDFEPAIEMALVRGAVKENLKLYGRLQGSFQSNVFSPSGKYMFYLPGGTLPSNGDEQWDVVIRDVEERRDLMTLVGHRDAIMWTGFSSDESLVGTVCWDKTIKIWDAKTGEVKFTFETNGQNWTGGFSPDGTMFAGTCGDGSVHVYSLHDGIELFWSKFGRWCRALGWTPDSAFLAVGGQDFGKLVLIDVKKQAVVQERLLSASRTNVKKEEMRRMLGGYLEVQTVRFVDGGRKLVHFTSGDGSAEVFDLGRCCKWRFARTGTDSYAEDVKGEEETVVEEGDKVTSKGGYQMIVWEDTSKGLAMLATVDGDAVRLWSVPLTT